MKSIEDYDPRKTHSQSHCKKLIVGMQNMQHQSGHQVQCLTGESSSVKFTSGARLGVCNISVSSSIALTAYQVEFRPLNIVSLTIRDSFKM